MGVVALLLDNVRVTRSLASDNALATLMAVKRQTVSQWRSGYSYPDDDKLARLIDLAGGDSTWALRVETERDHGAMTKHWHALARRLGTAATLALAVLLPSQQPKAAAPESSTAIHYANRLLRYWNRLLQRLPDRSVTAS